MSKNDSNIETKKANLLPWMTALLMVLGASVLIAMYWNRNVTVEELSFSGNAFTETEQLIEAANVTFGVKPDSLDLESLVNRIEALHYVKQAIPYVEPSGELEIDITERHPIALLVDEDKRAYIDEDGVRLPIISGKTLDLPIVYGFKTAIGTDTTKGKAFEQVRDFLVDAKHNKFGWTTISEVVYSPEEGVVALSHENGVKLVFGDHNFETKLENWEVFYKEIIRTKGIRSIQTVDLRFTNQVVTREI